jgi:hypothetical protein
LVSCINCTTSRHFLCIWISSDGRDSNMIIFLNPSMHPTLPLYYCECVQWTRSLVPVRHSPSPLRRCILLQGTHCLTDGFFCYEVFAPCIFIMWFNTLLPHTNISVVIALYLPKPSMLLVHSICHITYEENIRTITQVCPRKD